MNTPSLPLSYYANKVAWLQARAEYVILLGILVSALALRLVDIRQPFVGDRAWNEVYYAYLARQFNDGNLIEQYDIHTGATVYSTPLVPWMIYGAFRIFSEVEWAARLPMLLFGMLTLLIFYGIVRLLFGPTTALASVFLAACAPGIIFFSRNVQLDGVMTACGYAALLAVLLYRLRRNAMWAGLGFFALAVAIFTKYSAVLFMPALTWAWFYNSDDIRSRRQWATFALGVSIASLPALLWLIFARNEFPQKVACALSISHYGQDVPLSLSAYLFRFEEWGIRPFLNAFMQTWSYLTSQIGAAIWYPALAITTVVLITFRVALTLRTIALPLLLILPWFAQIIYPKAWLANEYYTYPALYGLCLLIVLFSMKFYHRFLAGALASRQATVLIALAGLIILFSNTWEYRNGYHQSYFPWALIRQDSPAYSARQVAAINQDHKPVLADVAQTLWYSGANICYGRWIWWWSEPEAFVNAVKSRQFEYVALMYTPPVAIINALSSSGYEQIAPAAWQQKGR